MSSQNRGERIQLLHKVAKKYYKPIEPTGARPLLEHLLYACCLEDARYEAAEEAFHRLQESYFDWNEIRVTTVTELGEVLRNLPDPLAAGNRIKRNLQSIFESRYSFDIEDMRKMNQGKAIQELEKLGGMSKFVLGYVIQNAFGGHTIPVSNSIMRILVATGIVAEQEASKHLVPGLDRAISKSKGMEFASCLQQFAADLHVQPTNKNLKAILKEAGAVDPPKRPVVAPAPEKKGSGKKSAAPLPADKKPATKKAAPEKGSSEKPVAERPAAEKPIAEKPVSEKPGAKKVPESKTPAVKPTPKHAAAKPPADKKASPPKKVAGHANIKKDTSKKPAPPKKMTPQKLTKRKPK